jgi:hypothetical protein
MFRAAAPHEELMPPSPVDYQRQSDGSRRSRHDVFSVAGAVMGVLVAGFIIAGASIAGQFAMIYRDFNLKLPWGTQVLLDLNRLLREAFYVPVLLIPLALGFLLPLLDGLLPPADVAQRRFLRGSLAFAILLALCMLVSVLVILALLWPMVMLMQGMSASPNKP